MDAAAFGLADYLQLQVVDSVISMTTLGIFLVCIAVICGALYVNPKVSARQLLIGISCLVGILDVAVALPWALERVRAEPHHLAVACHADGLAFIHGDLPGDLEHSYNHLCAGQLTKAICGNAVNGAPASDPHLMDRYRQACRAKSDQSL